MEHKQPPTKRIKTTTFGNELYLLSYDEQRDLLVAAFHGNVDTINNIIGRLPTKQQQKLACDNTRYEELLGIVRTSPKMVFIAGMTPLHIACDSGSIEAVNALCEKWGADVNVTDLFNRTPLHLACIKGHSKVAEVLFLWGAKKGESITKSVTSGDGATPLHYACHYTGITDDYNIIKIMWNVGDANKMEWWNGPEARKDYGGSTPSEIGYTKKLMKCLLNLVSEDKSRAVAFLCAWHPRLGVNSMVFRLGVPMDVAHYIIAAL